MMKKLHFFRVERARFVYLKNSAETLGNATAEKSEEVFDKYDAKQAIEGKSYKELVKIQELELSIRANLKIPGLINGNEQKSFAERLRKLREGGGSIHDYEALHQEVENIAEKRHEIHDKLMQIELGGFMPEKKLRKLKTELARPTTDIKTAEELIDEAMEEDQERRENKKNYAALIKAHERYFGLKSRESDSYLRLFLEMVDIEDQRDALNEKNFEREILKPRKDLVDKYEAFSSERQEPFKYFLDEGSEDKGKTIETMKGHLKDEYRKTTMGSKALSDESKDLAMNYLTSMDFRTSKGITAAENALVHLRNRIATEEKLCREFEALPSKIRTKVSRDFSDIYANIIKPGLQSSIDHQSEPRSFKELCAEERTVLLKYIKDHGAEFAKEETNEDELKQKYSTQLESIQKYAKTKGLKGEVLSEKTRDLFLEWFEREMRKDKSKDKKMVAKILEDTKPESREFQERINRLETFEKLLKDDDLAIEPERKRTLQDEFNKKSHTERGFMIADLQREKNAMKNPSEAKEGNMNTQVKHLKYAAAIKEVQGKTDAAIKLYEAILVLNPDDKPTQKHLDELKKKMGYKTAEKSTTENGETKEVVSEAENKLIEEAIGQAKNSDVMHKNLTIAYMAEMMGMLVKKSDDYNKGQSRTEHLDTSGKKQLQDEVMEESGGNKMLDKEGNVIERTTVDLNKIGVDPNDPDQYMRLQRMLTKKQDEKEQTNVFNLKVVKKDEGRELTGNQAYELGQNLAQEALEEMVERTCAILKAKTGSLRPGLKREIERRIVGTKKEDSLKKTRELRGGRLEVY